MVYLFCLTLGLWHPPLTKDWDNKTLEETERKRTKAFTLQSLFFVNFLGVWHRYCLLFMFETFTSDKQPKKRWTGWTKVEKEEIFNTFISLCFCCPETLSICRSPGIIELYKVPCSYLFSCVASTNIANTASLLSSEFPLALMLFKALESF